MERTLASPAALRKMLLDRPMQPHRTLLNQAMLPVASPEPSAAQPLLARQVAEEAEGAVMALADAVAREASLRGSLGSLGSLCQRWSSRTVPS